MEKKTQFRAAVTMIYLLLCTGLAQAQFNPIPGSGNNSFRFQNTTNVDRIGFGNANNFPNGTSLPAIITVNSNGLSFPTGEVFRTDAPNANTFWRMYRGGVDKFRLYSDVGGTVNLGTTDNEPLVMETNSIQRMYIDNDATGFVGIGNSFSSPNFLLHINSNNDPTGDLFRSTAPDNLLNRWVMASSDGINLDGERFFIEKPSNAYDINAGTSLDGEFSFITNRDDGGNGILKRSMFIDGGSGGSIHGRVTMGNQIPDGFNPQERLHLHQFSTSANTNLDNTLIRFTSDYTNGGIAPTPKSGFEVGILNYNNPPNAGTTDAIIRMWEDEKIRFYTNGDQRMVITESATDGYIYMGNNTPNPTSRLDIDGDLRIRKVEVENSPDALIVGKQHGSNSNDMDVRRLNFNGQSGFYLGGNGQWIQLPPPSGVSANNGVSYSTPDPNTIAFGQNFNDPNDPAALQNKREIPMNNYDIVFTDENAINGGNSNRIGIGTNGPAARLHVRTNENIQEPQTVGIRVDNLQTTSTQGSSNLGIKNLVKGMNNYNIGIDIEVSEASLINSCIDATSSSPIGSYGVTGLNRGGHFEGEHALKNRGVGGTAYSDQAYSGGTNYAVQGTSFNGENNVGGHFKAIVYSGVNTINNYGVWAQTQGTVTGRTAAIYGRSLNPLAANTWGGFFDGRLYTRYDAHFITDVFVTGDVWCNDLHETSDQIFKTDINEISNAMTTLTQLQPRTFYYDTVNFTQFDFETDQQMGFIAQEMENVLPSIVSITSSTEIIDSLGNVLTPSVEFKTVESLELIPLLVAGIQEQQAELNVKDSLINDLNDRLTAIENCLSNVGICNANFHAPVQTSGDGQERASQEIELKDGESIVLEQNVPNPFAERTVIDYHIPAYVGKAELYFYNDRGVLINSMEINERGPGHVNVYAADLSSGIYTYTLIADGKVVSTKKMMKN